MGIHESTIRTGKGFDFPLLLGILFIVVGLGMACWVAFELLASWKMQSWIETPAVIVKAKLEVTPDMEGNSPSYKATAEYRYRYGDREYTGNRVSIHGGSDNIGSYQQDVHRQLRGYQSSGQPFHCFVNLANPAESILFREFRWELIGLWALLTLVFCGAGMGMAVYSLIRRKNRQL